MKATQQTGKRSPRRAARVALACLVALLAAAPARCGGEERAPAEAPPWGLEGVVLPDDAASVSAVFAALPAAVAGRPRAPEQPGDRKGARYGTPELGYVSLTGTSVDALMLELPGLEGAADLLRVLAESGDVEVEAQALGPDEPLVYLAFATTANGRLVHGAAWGAPDGAWVFGAEADTAETRAALVGAFVASVRAASAG